MTNTNWQAYSGESTMGHLVQMAGLAVQNFASAAVGMAVAIALVRGFAARRSDAQLGNFWVDLTRTCVRILLPIAFVGAIVFVAAGMVQNFSAGTSVNTLAGAAQIITGGPVASQEVIKELGTNGGGFYNVNSAHPFENPTGWTNALEIFLLLVISFSLPRTFGRLVGDKRQGFAIVAVMAVILVGSLAVNEAAQNAAPRHRADRGRRRQRGHRGPLRRAAVGGLRDRDDRRRRPARSTRSTTRTPSIGGATLLFNMMLGEVAPGGTGSGLYGILILAVITVFVAGLMIGRTPEYLGKKIGSREIRLASLYLLDHADGRPGRHRRSRWRCPAQRAGMLNSGAHGLSEVLYAFTSAGNNNGSAFAGITRQHRLVQHRARARHAASAGSCRSCSSSRWPARSRGSGRCPSPPARCRRTGRSSSACSSA